MTELEQKAHVYEVKFTKQIELKWFFDFMRPENLIFEELDQQAMYSEIVIKVLNKIKAKYPKFVKSCIIKFTPGEAASVRFLFDYYYKVILTPADPVHNTGLRVRNELLRQQFNFDSTKRLFIP